MVTRSLTTTVTINNVTQSVRQHLYDRIDAVLGSAQSTGQARRKAIQLLGLIPFEGDQISLPTSVNDALVALIGDV
jgi:hypothetical protein